MAIPCRAALQDRLALVENDRNGNDPSRRRRAGQRPTGAELPAGSGALWLTVDTGSDRPLPARHVLDRNQAEPLADADPVRRISPRFNGDRLGPDGAKRRGQQLR